MEIETWGQEERRKKHCSHRFESFRSLITFRRWHMQINIERSQELIVRAILWISAVSCNLIGLSIKVNRRISPAVDRPSACPEIVGVKLWLANLHE